MLVQSTVLIDANTLQKMIRVKTQTFLHVRAHPRLLVRIEYAIAVRKLAGIT